MPTRLGNILLAIDRFLAALLYNRADITISALCWVVLYAPTEKVAASALVALDMQRWQVWTLTQIGKGLEWLQPTHLTTARQTELTVAGSTLQLLGEKP